MAEPNQEQLRAALAEMMAREQLRTQFKAPQDGAAWENNHASPPQQTQRPNQYLAPAYQGAADGLVGMSPPAVAYGMGHAAGDTYQAAKQGDVSGAAGNAAQLAAMWFPMWRKNKAIAERTIDPATDPVGWYVQEHKAGRTPRDNPRPQEVPQPTQPAEAATRLTRGGALDGIDGPAPDVPQAKSSYPPLGSAVNDSIRADYMNYVREYGQPPAARDFNTAAQKGYEGVDPRVPRLNTRVNETNNRLTQFEQEMGRLPATRDDYYNQVFASGKPGSIPKGTLGIAGGIGAASAMAPDDTQAANFDPEQYKRWIAEQLMMRQ